MSAPQREQREATALNLVRGLAALAVVVCHVRSASLPAFGALASSQKSFPTKLFYGFTSLGTEAVVIFFVLSGYLVFGRIILRLGTFDARRYFVDRATRIMVPLVPACGLMACVALVIRFPISLWGALAHAIGLNEVFVDTYAVNGPLWTLAYEIWFYVLGGALAAIAARKRPVLALSVLSVAVLVFSKLDSRFLLYWLVGGVMVLLRQRMRPLALLGLPVIAGGIVLYKMNSALVGADQVAAALGQTLIAVGFAFTLPFLASEQSTRHLAPLAGLASGLSAISYSLYLTHFPVWTLSRFVAPPALRSMTGGIVDLAARTALCLILATAFWWLFERNTDKVRLLLHSRPWGPSPEIGAERSPR